MHFLLLRLYNKNISQEQSKPSSLQPVQLVRGRFQRPRPNIGRGVGRKETGAMEKNESEVEQSIQHKHESASSSLTAVSLRGVNNFSKMPCICLASPKQVYATVKHQINQCLEDVIYGRLLNMLSYCIWYHNRVLALVQLISKGLRKTTCIWLLNWAATWRERLCTSK